MLCVVSGRQISSSQSADQTIRRCQFDMRSELLPSELVTEAILRIYKFPAYGGVATTGSSHAHSSIELRVDVYRLRHSVVHDWLVVSVSCALPF